MSLIPVKAIFNVLGIGVAESVRTSVSNLNLFKASLCLTPKRCSSSITISPRFLNSISLDKSI